MFLSRTFVSTDLWSRSFSHLQHLADSDGVGNQGRSQAGSVPSDLARILQHLLQWTGQPDFHNFHFGGTQHVLDGRPLVQQHQGIPLLQPGSVH